MPHLRRRPKELTIQERHIYHAERDRCPSCGEPLHLCGHYNSLAQDGAATRQGGLRRQSAQGVLPSYVCHAR